MTGRVVVVRDFRELQSIEEEWHELARSASFGEWFAGPHWIQPLLQYGLPNIRPAICLVYSGRQLQGVVPLVERAAGAIRFELPRSPHARRIGWLARSNPAEVLLAALEAVSQHPHLGAATLSQIEVGSEEERHVNQMLARRPLGHFRVEETRSAVADLSDGWESYLTSRDGKLRRTLRRHRKQIETEPGWQLKCVQLSGELFAAWNDVLAVETRSWKHKVGSSIANEPGTGPLYSTVASAFARSGGLRLWLLYKDELPVAHALCVISGGRCYLLKNSYDESFRRYAVGQLLVWHSMERAAFEGVHKYDFLGDNAAWKAAFATHAPLYFSWSVFSPWRVDLQVRRLARNIATPGIRSLVAKRFNLRATVR